MTTFIYPEKKLREIKLTAHQIMKQEMQLTMRGNRLVWNNYLYRIQFLIFENRNHLGYFDPEHMEIGIHKSAKNFRDILRHELAHMIAYLRFGDLSHGKVFRTICKEYGFPSEIEKATGPLLQESRESRIASKIKKLLALAESTNAHESESAALKAQEMLLKHDIEEETDMVMRRIFTFKRASTKYKAIAKILRTFGVQPVFCSKTLEIFGQRLHVEIAEYVAHFLSNELDHLYKKQLGLHGLAAKNSFFRGVAEGYCEKAKKAQTEQERALVKIDFALQKAIPLAYPNLRTSYSRIVNHSAGNLAGKKTGHNLKIRKGVSSKSQTLAIDRSV
ncbi:MAG: hypothetical protein ChlgKO_05680 [Chlamydiales bacterium]